MSGRDRKNSLKALFGGESPMEPKPQPQTPAGFAEEQKTYLPPETRRAPETKAMTPDMLAQAVPRAASGAVKAMGMSLSSITREAEEGKALRETLAKGERVVLLDPARIDSSFVNDRLSDAERDDPDFNALVLSMAESGQQVPILVRPVPHALDRYQVAYGHRRLKAARRLGQPVQAIVRDLSDEDLILAQGKENAERRNLSFIERALFADTLLAAGFERKVICAALSLQKSELSRLLQVADGIPKQVARAIGPAPKAGRERWMALTAMFAEDDEIAMTVAELEMATTEFHEAPSDLRFQRLFDRLTRRLAPKPEAARIDTVKGPDGQAVARVETKGRGVRIDFSDAADPAFVESFIARLEAAYALFARGPRDG